MQQFELRIGPKAPEKPNGRYGMEGTLHILRQRCAIFFSASRCLGPVYTMAWLRCDNPKPSVLILRTSSSWTVQIHSLPSRFADLASFLQPPRVHYVPLYTAGSLQISELPDLRGRCLLTSAWITAERVLLPNGRPHIQDLGRNLGCGFLWRRNLSVMSCRTYVAMLYCMSTWFKIIEYNSRKERMISEMRPPGVVSRIPGGSTAPSFSSQDKVGGVRAGENSSACKAWHSCRRLLTPEIYLSHWSTSPRWQSYIYSNKRLT